MNTQGTMKRTYKPPKIVETYKDMKHFVLLHICYECPFNRDDTPNDFHCVNFDTLMDDDCPIWTELRECYI